MDKNKQYIKIGFDLDRIRFIGTNEKSQGYYNNSQYAVFMLRDKSNTQWKIKIDLKNVKVVNTVELEDCYNYEDDYLQFEVSKEKYGPVMIQYKETDELKYTNLFITWKDVKDLILLDTTIDELLGGE